MRRESGPMLAPVIGATLHTYESAKASWLDGVCGAQVALLRGVKAPGRLLVLVQALTSPKLATVDDAAGAIPAPLQVRLLLVADP